MFSRRCQKSTSNKITANSDDEDDATYSSGEDMQVTQIHENERDTLISSPRNSSPSENDRSPSPDPESPAPDSPAPESPDPESPTPDSPDPESPIDFSSGDEHASSFQRRDDVPTSKARRSRFRRGEPTRSDFLWADQQPEGTVEGYERNHSSEDDSPRSP